MSKIHTVVQSKDEKKYIEELITIYKRFVKPHASEIQDKKKKDPETIEELDRQLKYMEKFISDFKALTSKNHNKSLKNIKKRTFDNQQLIEQLSEMRKIKEDHTAEIKKIDMSIQQENTNKQKMEANIGRLNS